MKRTFQTFLSFLLNIISATQATAKVHPSDSRSYLVAFGSIRSFTSEYIEIEDRDLPIRRGCRDGVLGLLNV